MRGRRLIRTLPWWLLLAAIMPANGAVRDLALVPLLGPTAGQWTGLFTAIAATWIVMAVMLSRPGLRGAHLDLLLAIGLSWAALAVAFEIVVFGLIVGTPWSALAAQYDLFAGATWPWYLLAVIVGPPTVARAIDRGGSGLA